MDKSTDEQIIEGLLSADVREVDKAFTALYQQHYSLIESFISRNSGTADDAADLFQDALIVFYNRIREGRLVLNCTTRTYLYSVCKNLWLKKLRSRKKQIIFSEDISEIQLAAEETDILADTDEDRKIGKLFSQLGADCQRILTFFYFDRLRMKEIAAKMGFANEQVAKNKKSICLSRLRKMVKDQQIDKDRS
ncbi:MAG: sigma-70 family RNA polymerase sigma factor [Bacteroidota bacterium]